MQEIVEKVDMQTDKTDEERARRIDTECLKDKAIRSGFFLVRFFGSV